MNLSPTGPLVCWQDGDAWQTGRVLLTDDGKSVTPCCGLQDFSSPFTCPVLIQCHPTGEIVFVEWSKVKPYPESPIPNPDSKPEPLAELQQAVRALYDRDQALLNCRDCEVADKLKDKEAAIDKLYELTGVVG